MPQPPPPPPPPPPPAADLPLHLDSIPTVDLRLLSQSELYSLSLCSSSTFDPRRCDDVVIPKIDRSVFNESAGSRKQTYSRLRLVPASASPSSLRRRGPRLRSTNHNLPSQYIDTDPEQVESRQIVSLLKQLFGVEGSAVSVNGSNTEELTQLVPIRVDYSETVPRTANVGFTGLKRKRGRPRKNENTLVLVENIVEGQCENEVPISAEMTDVPMAEAMNEVPMVAEMNEIVVRENMEDRDKEIVNRDGVEVDLVGLGSMENPYGEELRRRTEGMESEEQLLGLLKGLNGQWGSRRKKKRIVDASEFGNALPKGWRLMLSCKKKEGRVWLFCRRYISPNGRQFVSFKEISAYLLSLHGIQDVNQKTSAQTNVNVEAVDKMAFVNTADVAVPEEKREENAMCQILSPAVASISGNCEVQVTLKTGDLPAIQEGDVLNCEKCNLIFSSQDDLLHHQLSSHRRRRSKNGESVTDGVIIKGGKYECQFCHKTFEERNRYNGHMGAHIRNQAKGSDESRVVDVQECVGPVSLDLTHGDSMVQTSIGLESSVVADFVKKNADYWVHSSNVIVDKQNANYEELNDKLRRANDTMNVDATKSNLCLGSEVILSTNESKDHREGSGDANVAEDAAGGIEKFCHGQQRNFENCSPFLVDKQTGGSGNNVIGLSESKRKVVSGSVLHSSNENLGSHDIDLDVGDFSHTVDKATLDENKIMGNGSIHGFCNKNVRQVDNPAIGDKLQAQFVNHACNVENVKNKSISTNTVYEQKISHKSSNLTPSGDKKEKNDRAVYGNFPPLTFVGDNHNKMYEYGRKMHASSAELDRDAPISLREERDIGSSAVVPSWNEQPSVVEKYKNEVSTGFLEGQEQSKNSEKIFPSLSDFEGSCGVDDYVGKFSARQMQEPQLNDVQNIRNAELDFPFSGSNNGVTLNAVTDSKHERSFEFRSFFPSENGRIFCLEDNKQESKKEPSGSVLIAQSSITGASDEGYDMNKIFTTQVDERKYNVIGNSKSHGLCLTFDSQASSSGVELEKYTAKSLNTDSGIKQIYGMQSSLDNVAHGAAENPKEGRSFGIDLHVSSFSDKSCEFENNFNLVYPGNKVDEAGNSANKFMVGFGSSNDQQVDNVMAGSIWRTSEETLMRPSPTDTATPLVQSTNNFHTFDIISDKGHEDLFGVDHKYDCNTGLNGLTLGRTEPMEYTFMTSQSSNSLPGESKGFSYNANAEQGFGSSFWLGKDALMPNMTGRNQVPTVCVWCRNEFYEDAIQSGAQTGAIGSMCPTCSSRISQQFNVL